MPPQFKRWLEANAKRIARAKQLPYFLRDNGAVVDGEYRLKEFAAPAPTSPNMPADLTIEQQKAWVDNEQQVAKLLGMKQGQPMTFDQANEHRGNPHYVAGSGDGYTVNCQSCVVANELRRRGYDVEAWDNTQKKGNIPHELSYDTSNAWIDPVTGTKPKKTWINANVSLDRRGRLVRRAKQLKEDLLRHTAEQGRYHLNWGWKSKKSGHVIALERLEDGALRFYDPQTGKLVQWEDVVKNIDLKLCYLLRVDNLMVNTDIIDGIVAKVGTTEPETHPKLKIPIKKLSAVYAPYVEKYKEVVKLGWSDEEIFAGWARLGLSDEFIEGIKEHLTKLGLRGGTLGADFTNFKTIFNQYDSRLWEHTMYDRRSSGYVVTEQTRIAQSQKNKQEMAKYNKELSMCKTLARNGHHVEYLNDTMRPDGSYDVLIDGVKADLKKTGSTNHIAKYAKKAAREQGAEMVVFEFERITSNHINELQKLTKQGIHGYYFETGSIRLFEF